jgi:hypothetical protein
MGRHRSIALWIGVCLASLAAVGCRPGSPGTAAPAESLALEPATMPRIGTIEDRFQSYNVEMLEVTRLVLTPKNSPDGSPKTNEFTIGEISDTTFKMKDKQQIESIWTRVKE